MSRCRCGDITNLEGIIGNLENARKKLCTYGVRKDKMNEELSRCFYFAQQATDSDKLIGYRMTAIGLTSEMDATVEHVMAKINSSLADLRASLASMRSKDREYHEELLKAQMAAREKERNKCILEEEGRRSKPIIE